ncbi:calcineurin-like phosphoesterase [Hirsutella rhossiliensis]|uniref:Calcineurin-like phosphoesterase domain-containing protein n=1 Tax=Hirsutella rhossiliensis TaxID=111463 RepID=A0A9P8N5W5_9HYPO|nr:calcineurin-like phosphoesterase domain-containing protein [Hirsutella rhossiliensis]KAH0966551.1 calcineurin-like phosphoesterase domain-containing protein [Hirsutella rhossiliensis]
MLPILLALAAFVASSTQAALPTPTALLKASTKNQDLYSKSSKDISPLTFDDNGNFQISIFEDLHFGENAWDSWGPEQDIHSVKVIDKVLDQESPGLVVLNGDLITGDNAFLENSTVYIDQIVKPLLDRDLFWASTYGNHDYGFNISGVDILAREKLWPNSLTLSMVAGIKAGVSNYYLPVYAPDCHESQCAPELLLWFFDSRGGLYSQEHNADGTLRSQPGWVDTSVVEWFQAASSRIAESAGRTIPSLAFVHIPTNASQALQTEHGRDSIHPNHQPGINDDYPLAPQAQGWCSDGRNDGSCQYGGQDLPFMKAIASTPGLIALFSGHDHGDSWCYKWDRLLPGMTVTGNGVNLCFGQRSGYGGYGHWIRGSRQVRVSRDKLRTAAEAETWIRLETGDFVGSVTLNASYGKDWYPATPNDMTYCPTCNYSISTQM